MSQGHYPPSGLPPGPRLCRLALLGLLALLAAVWRPPAAQAAPIQGLILVIDIGTYRDSAGTARDGLLHDIAAANAAAADAPLAIIALEPRTGKLDIRYPQPRDRQRIADYVRTELALDAPPPGFEPTINLDILRQKLVEVATRWGLATARPPGAAPRVVRLRVFARRWYLDRHGAETELFAYEYSNICLQQFAYSHSPWPAATVLDIAFRPPPRSDSPPASAYTGFVVALTGKAEPPPYLIYRGWSPPHCLDNAATAVPFVQHVGDSPADCPLAARPAKPGPAVAACEAVPRLPAIAANLVLRPVHLTTSNGDAAADEARLADLQTPNHTPAVRVGRLALPNDGRRQSLAAGGSGGVDAQFAPRSGCRNGASLSFAVQAFRAGEARPVQERSAAVAFAPCAPFDLPVDDLRVR